MTRQRSPGIFISLILTVLFTGSTAPIGFAVARQAGEIEPGVQYSGETVLRVSEYGISFTLPQGWVGGLPQGAEFFVMQSPELQAYVVAGIEELTLARAQQLMGDDIDLGNGIVLRPASGVTTEGAVLKADYDVAGTPEPLVGRVTTHIGDHGYGVFFIVAAVPGDFDAVIATVEQMGDSVSLTAPAATPAPGPRSWQEQLAGRKLSHFYTGSGYTEEDYIWLCADGRFFRNASSGGFGGGASGAFQSQYGGRWEASGTAQSGTLSLRYNDGRTASYVLTIEDEKLYLDDSRYFRELTDCR